MSIIMKKKWYCPCRLARPCQPLCPHNCSIPLDNANLFFSWVDALYLTLFQGIKSLILYQIQKFQKHVVCVDLDFDSTQWPPLTSTTFSSLGELDLLPGQLVEADGDAVLQLES